MVQNTRASRRTETARYSKVRLTVVGGPDTGVTHEAAGRTLIVGTASDCDIVLHDDTVSRRHCEIELVENGFRVRDSDSTNGVRVQGMRVYDLMCSEPLEVVLGETRLSVLPLSETEDRERANEDRFGALIGGSRKMRELFAVLERLSPTSLSVLIEGETGVGKDVVAESVHAESGRREGPFVVFDCSAVAPNLIENELFGHAKDAFTGATRSSPGIFVEADGGTLFLDEIGELPRDIQPKLLRVLEKREVRRLGARHTERVDVRVLAATNRNLEVEVREGRFREDLYFRLAGARVVVPPLRERLEDLPALVRHFLHLEAPKMGASDVPEYIWAMFRRHRWPGNVRELRNAVQRLVVAPELALRPLEVTKTEVAAPEGSGGARELLPLRTARNLARDAFERDYLRAILRATGGNVSRAAALAEVSRQMIQKLMRKHDLEHG
ncbi:MAG: sigma 54-interacting transcriptional regulator [Myxococcales bacterium]|nr:sigma 54-interacting transcriptional regulator [Myxococcales bacterium]